MVERGLLAQYHESMTGEHRDQGIGFSSRSLELADPVGLATQRASILEWDASARRFVPSGKEFQFFDCSVAQMPDDVRQFVVSTLENWIREAAGGATVYAKGNQNEARRAAADTLKSSKHILEQILEIVNDDEPEEHLVIAFDARGLPRGFSVYEIDPSLEFMQEFATVRPHFLYSTYRAADPETLFDASVRRNGDIGGVGAALAIYHARVAASLGYPVRAHATSQSSASSYWRLGFVDDTPTTFPRSGRHDDRDKRGEI
ncbi:hypothetical protein [Sorangium sp. So ce861]|uniref:hypothetical protein n=1 Tax=Sorangium sp. So ce861 TaxID=3133323 RepID=UPI003F625F2A